MTPNRVVALATALFGLVAAVCVPLANLDWSSTAGVIAGIGAVALTANRWLIGWQGHEERQAYNAAILPQTAPTPDEGDAGQPEAKSEPRSRKR